jgi:hypothetical protein
MYKGAVATTVLVYAVLTILWALEQRMRRSPDYRHHHPMRAAEIAETEKRGE